MPGAIEERASIGPLTALDRTGDANELSFEQIAGHSDNCITVAAHVHEGNVRRIIVKDEKGQTFLEIPLGVGAVAAFFLPVLAALGAMAALASNFTLEVVRRDDSAPPSA